MEAKASVLDHPYPSGDLFKLMWTGYFWGAGVFFLPIAAVVGLASLFTDAPEAVFVVLAVPCILALQGVIFSGIILFGLGVFRRATAIRGSGR